MTIQTPAKAQATVTKLETRKDALERQVERLLATAAGQYSEAAEGAPIDSDELVRLQAELKIVDQMLAAAEQALHIARRIDAARIPLARLDDTKKRLAKHSALAAEANVHLDAAAELLEALVVNGRALNSALQFGRDAVGPKGYAVFDRTLLTTAHVQHVVQCHFARRVHGWVYEMLPPAGARHSFAEMIDGAVNNFDLELDLLVGTTDLLPEDVAAIRAEQAQVQLVEEA